LRFSKNSVIFNYESCNKAEIISHIKQVHLSLHPNTLLQSVLISPGVYRPGNLLENGRYGHAPIRSDTSIRVYTTADTDTSTLCIGVPATCNIRPARSLRERSLYAMGGTCRPLATHKLACYCSVSFMTG